MIRNSTCFAFRRDSIALKLTFDLFNELLSLLHLHPIYLLQSEGQCSCSGTDNMTDWTTDSNEALHLSLGISSRISELPLSLGRATQYAPLQIRKFWVTMSRTRTSIPLSPIRSVRTLLRLLSPFSLTLVQIYGEDEKIYGYTDLLIDVRFACFGPDFCP